MEFNVKTVPIAKFYLPTSNSSVSGVTFSLNGSDPTSLAPSAPASNIVSVTLPYLSEEGEIDLIWTFQVPGSGTFSETERHTVITPLLTVEQIKEIHPNATDDEVYSIERATRLIINAFTGQDFGHFTGSRKVRGSGNKALLLPQRVITLTQINSVDIDPRFLLSDDGWTLYKFPFGLPPYLDSCSDPYSYFAPNGEVWQSLGVIVTPYSNDCAPWAKNIYYDVNAEWGYYSVPPAVQEAARLLVNDYACGDSQYRDRYLTSMTAADWRIQFQSGAFRDTGNVRADQLLADFVLKGGWALI